MNKQSHMLNDAKVGEIKIKNTKIKITVTGPAKWHTG